MLLRQLSRIGAPSLAIVFICSLLEFVQGADIEKQELKLMLEQLQKENGSLRKKEAEYRERLGVATNRLEKIQNGEVPLKNGISADDEEARTANEWRSFLVIALNSLSEADREVRQLQQRLRMLLYASRETFKSAEKVDPTKRALLEKELRETQKMISEKQEDKGVAFIGDPDSSALAEVKIVGVKLELGVAALNAGRKQGAKVGMPFIVVRNKTALAVLLIAEVRENAALALIEQMDSGKPIREGDIAVLRKK